MNCGNTSDQLINQYGFHKGLAAYTVLLCLLLSFFFAEAERKQVVVSLIAGSLLHLLLDLFQKHMQPGYTLLFPFSRKAFEFGLLWPETIVSMAPLWILIIGVMELLGRLNKEKS